MAKDPAIASNNNSVAAPRAKLVMALTSKNRVWIQPELRQASERAWRNQLSGRWNYRAREVATRGPVTNEKQLASLRHAENGLQHSSKQRPQLSKESNFLAAFEWGHPRLPE